MRPIRLGFFAELVRVGVFELAENGRDFSRWL
jgi:hypothetical protein